MGPTTEMLERERYLRDLARVAYNGYCSYTFGKSLITGENLPIWEDLREDIKSAWTEAMKAVFDVAE